MGTIRPGPRTSLRERASLIQATEEYVARHQQLEDLSLMLDMALEEEDQPTLKEVVKELTGHGARLHRLGTQAAPGG